MRSKDEHMWELLFYSEKSKPSPCYSLLSSKEQDKYSFGPAVQYTQRIVFITQSEACFLMVSFLAKEFWKHSFWQGFESQKILSTLSEIHLLGWLRKSHGGSSSGIGQLQLISVPACSESHSCCFWNAIVGYHCKLIEYMPLIFQWNTSQATISYTVAWEDASLTFKNIRT